jgi:hypothetical protein
MNAPSLGQVRLVIVVARKWSADTPYHDGLALALDGRRCQWMNRPPPVLQLFWVRRPTD